MVNVDFFVIWVGFRRIPIYPSTVRYSNSYAVVNLSFVSRTASFPNMVSAIAWHHFCRLFRSINVHLTS